MQNAFPYLLSQILYVPLLLRLVAGSYFIIFGYRGLTSKWPDRYAFFDRNRIRPTAFFATATAVVDIVAGALLMMGFATQVVALVLLIVCITAIASKDDGFAFPEWDQNVYILLSVILFSLFISGAGFHAMDIPL